MGTSFGHLPTKLKVAVAWLDIHDTTAAPLTDAHYQRLRAADQKKPRGQREVPELFTRIYRLLDANDETKAAYRHYTRDILRTIYGHLLQHYNLRSAFPPYHARFLVDYYAPKAGPVVVLDPCAGWGGRLLGTLAIPRTDTVRYIGTDPNAKGDLAGEVDAFLDAGVDALFSDNPDIAVATRDSWLAGEGAA